MEQARLKKKFRNACGMQALAQGARRIQADSLQLRIVFVPPCRRHRDVDNCVSAMKAGFDGLADVLGVDDSRWQWSEPPRLSDDLGGFVRVEVTA